MTESALTAEELFARTQERFSTKSVLLNTLRSGYAFFGVNSRIGGRRVTVMRSSDRAIFLTKGLARLSDSELTAFVGLALVNKEQAEAAFRYTAIVNFTSPITILVVINQLVEGSIRQYFLNDTDGATYFFYTLLGITLFGAAFLLVASQGGVQFARDIYHLAIIEQSKRGTLSPNAEADGDEMPVTVDA